MSTITKEELAAKLNGCEYGEEVSTEVGNLARESGLLIVYGASDDLMEFDGLFSDEVGAYDGGRALIDAGGVLPTWESVCEEDKEDEAEQYFKRKPHCKEVRAIWCPNKTLSWRITADIPHAKFTVMEDGQEYCEGIVIHRADLA